jgi:uncharacterized protein YecT (DUF1311 family)
MGFQISFSGWSNSAKDAKKAYWPVLPLKAGKLSLSESKLASQLLSTNPPHSKLDNTVPRTRTIFPLNVSGDFRISQRVVLIGSADSVWDKPTPGNRTPQRALTILIPTLIHAYDTAGTTGPKASENNHCTVEEQKVWRSSVLLVHVLSATLHIRAAARSNGEDTVILQSGFIGCAHATNTLVLTRTIMPFVVILLLFGVGDPASAQTQSDLTEQACIKFKNLDGELNRVYSQILASNAGDASFVRALREAQRAWITFRDAHVKSIYPDPKPMAYGSVYPMCRCGILEQLTAQRTKELRERWVDGTVEGDVCAGSSPIKRANFSPVRKK